MIGSKSRNSPAIWTTRSMTTHSALLRLGGDCCRRFSGSRQLALLAGLAASSPSIEYGLPFPVSINALRLSFKNMLHAFEHTS